jgi:geranylgeranyl transferase type-2 subunit beta
MQPASYLALLNTRLADGVARLPEPTRARHAAYLRAAQNADGGFPDREGNSDLYYTGFGLRGLGVLDALTLDVCEKAAGFLRTSLTQSASVVDFFSLLYACLLVQASGGPDVLANSPEDWPERTAALLETFRTPDGGYSKTPGGASGSTYHTFLVGLCYQLLGKSLPDPAAIVRFVASRRREDGGFVEIAPMRRGGTNPTAAAMGLLQLTAPHGDALLGESRGGVVGFLTEMASVEGGLRANARAPLADLLSTFTASWTLHQLGALDGIDGDEARAFAEWAERPEGGFHGGVWDEGHDVEYTFYGLGILGLLG